jgi:hypothetical protein
MLMIVGNLQPPKHVTDMADITIKTTPKDCNACRGRLRFPSRPYMQLGTGTTTTTTTTTTTVLLYAGPFFVPGFVETDSGEEKVQERVKAPSSRAAARHAAIGR